MLAVARIWTLLGAAAYASSALLVVLLALRAWRGAPEPLRRFSGRVDAVLARVRTPHVVAITLLVVGGMLALHAVTLSKPGAANYYDLDGWWVPAAEAVVSGGNPYVPPGGVHTWENSINFGVVFPWMMGAAWWLGGSFGIVVLFAAFAAAAPILTYLLARGTVQSDALRAYAALLALALPQAFFYQVRSVQDEPVILTGFLLVLLLAQRGRLGTAAVIAGAFAAVKYVPLLLFAALVGSRLGARRRGDPSGLSWAAAFRLGLVSGSVFAAIMLAGWLAYGADYVQRTVRMGQLLPEPFGITLGVDVLRLAPAGARTWIFLVGFALVALGFHLRPPAPGRVLVRDVAIGATTVATFLLLFPLVNPDYVNPFLGLAIVHAFARAEGNDAQPPTWLVPAVLLGICVLSDARNWSLFYGSFAGISVEALYPIVRAGITTALAVIALAALAKPRAGAQQG